VHIAADVQGVPFGSCVQTLPIQLNPVTQSALVAQLVLQLVVPQTYGLHERSIPAAQVPEASQRPARCSAPALHESAPHTVFAAYLRQAPMPLHCPSSPQVLAPSSAHWPSGSIPSGTFLHVPSLPETAHDLHVPVHVVMQHLPCAQNVELHSASAPQLAPRGFLPQLPLTQVLGETQSASVVHVVRQDLPSPAHWYGAHDCVAAPEHVPESSHMPVVVRVDPTQVSAAQTTPAFPLKRAHAPVPSQTPVVPQVSAVWVGQRSPGSVPGSAGRQVPSVPGFTQVKQAAPQASLQHTPSTHWPEPQSEGELQGSPICFDGLSTPPVSLPPPVSIGTPMSTGASCPAST
jgi:hypothetical protein